MILYYKERNIFNQNADKFIRSKEKIENLLKI